MRALRFVILPGIVALGMAAVMAGDLLAQSNGAAVVKQRQDEMKQMQRAFDPMIAIFKGENPNVVDAAASAETINTNARKILDNFPEGTGRDAISESRAKPELWLEYAEFQSAAGKLVEESGKLVDVAGTGDLEAYKTQFKALGTACGGCHRGPPDSGGKFRFEKQ